MPRFFDYYIAVDWSAKNTPSPAKPSADALWVGEKDAVIGENKEFYFQTRLACFRYLQELLRQKVKEKKRVTIGFDLGFGYPVGYVDALAIAGTEPKWKKLWKLFTELLQDDENNKNNRFEVANQLNGLCISDHLPFGPLWGHPYKDTYTTLYYKSPAYPYTTKSGHVLKKHRWTEMKEPKAQPAWKLLGTASVGGQMLTGIPMIHKLRCDPEIESVSVVWPFETGFSIPAISEGSASVWFVEIWPGVIRDKLDKNIAIKDQAQVRATVDWIAELDLKSELAPFLEAPRWLSEQAIRECIEEEGWVLGAGLSSRDADDLNLRLL